MKSKGILNSIESSYKVEKKEKTLKILNEVYLMIKDETDVDIKQQKRTRDVADLVKIFCKFIRTKYPKISSADIGAFLNKDHATVLHAVKVYDDLHLTDLEFNKRAEHWKEKFYSVNSEDTPQKYKDKLISLIEVAHESVRKEMYQAILQIETIKNLKTNIIHE